MRMIRPIALPELVGNIHFHIFCDGLVKSGLRHFVDVGWRRFQIHQRCLSAPIIFNVYPTATSTFLPLNATPYL